jgi:hypothetical protein
MFNDIKHNHFDNIDEEIEKFQNDIKKDHKDKVRHITYCTQTLRNSELDAEKRSIAKIQGYISFKKHLLRELDSQEDMAYQLDEYEKRLGEAIVVLEVELMDIEMLLQDALEVATTKFKEKVKEINNKIIEKTSNLQQQLQGQSEEFFTDLKNHGYQAQESFIKWFDETYQDAEVPDSPRLNAKIEVLSEKDSTQQVLDQFKEHMDNGISKCEKDIKTKINEDWRKIEDEVSTNQHQRNRAIVEQIIKTCEQFKSENEAHFNKLREEYDDA